MAVLLVWARLALALLGFSALVTELATLAERDRLDPGNFFSYFTVESNLVAIAALLACVASGRRLDAFRGAATTYLITVFVAFSLLLAGIDADLTAVAWDNVVLHYLMPIGVVADWVLDPPHRHISFRQGVLWLAFPLIYLAYSLVRGPLVDWYPYPFLDPAHGGYGRVALVSLGITAIALAAVFAVTRVSRSATRRNT